MISQECVGKKWIVKMKKIKKKKKKTKRKTKKYKMK